MVDREKYINNDDYRQGYSNGVQDGKNQMVELIEYLFNEIGILKNYVDKKIKRGDKNADSN